MDAFQPDHDDLMLILREIEDVFRLVPEPTDFIELTDSVEPTDTVDLKMDMELTVVVDQPVDVDATMEMEWTETAAHTADADTTMDVVTSFDPTMPANSIASVDMPAISNENRKPQTFKQLFKIMVKRLFEVECNLLQNYLMIIMKCSTMDKTIRLMSGWILNHHLKYYYEVIPSEVIAYLKTECLTSFGDVSPKLRDCNYSLIMKLALKGLRKWPEIWPVIIEMLDSEEHSMYKGALVVLQMITNEFNLENLPNIPIDILIPKLITFFGSPSVTKRSMSVSIVKDFIVQKTPSLLNHIKLLLENLFVLDDEQTEDINEENNITLLRRDVCKSIITLVQRKCMPLDNIPTILRYMIKRSKDKDNKTVEAACKFWISISEEQSKIYRPIVFPHLYDIISAIAENMVYTQEDLISVQNGHASLDYPFFTDSDSIRKYCVLAIESMAIGFQEDVLPGVVRIINKKVSDTDLNTKEVAIVLLGCIAESKECRKSIHPYLETLFNNLIILNNYLVPGESLLRDKLLWTLVVYRDYIVEQPQFMNPLMTYMLRPGIQCPFHFSFLEGEAFWNLVTDRNLSKDAFRPYLTNVLPVIFNGLFYFKITSNEFDEHGVSADRSNRNDSTDAITNLIWIYKADILPIIMPMIKQNIASDDPRCKESGIVALGLLAKGGIGDMVTELPEYLTFMVDMLADHNPRLSAASCLSLGRFHDWIVNRVSHDKYFVPLMEYLLSTKTDYVSSDSYTLSCILFTLDFLLLDKPNSEELFAPYLMRIVINMCKAIVYSDHDIISLQGDDEVDIYYLDSPTIICERFDSSSLDAGDIETPRYKCSSESRNRGRAAHILYYITIIYKCNILPIIMPIIQSALKSDDWTIMESGIFALGIINRDGDIDTASNDIQWLPYFQEFFKCMMDNLSNKRPIVRANTMMTLSRYSSFIIKKSRKKYLIPLMRMISARVLDSNLNVRTTAWQVWNILRRKIINDEPVIKWYIDHIWKGLFDMVETYRRLRRGENCSLTNTRR